MTERLGQPVVVDSRPGAGGVLGVEIVAKSPADGYTIGVGGTGSLAGALSLMPQMPYDPLKDFAPITMMAAVPEILAVNARVPASTVAELVALAKAKPGGLSYGSGGNGTGPHLAGSCCACAPASTSCTCPIVAPRPPPPISFPARSR
ncbi:tripartite tricarboxylate transporter substrate-binding protein [Pseudoroseomonas wenyumeiae]